MIDMLVLEDRTIRSLLSDIRITALLPCLESVNRGLESMAKGCGKCGQQTRRDASRFLQAARQCIGDSPSATKGRLKQLLNTRQLRLQFRNGTGQIVTYTY